MDQAESEIPTEIAALVGAQYDFGAYPHVITAGSRLGRGPVAGVLQFRGNFLPNDEDPLAQTLALVVIESGGINGPIPSVQDRFGATLSFEFGTPSFVTPLGGGPFGQVGLDAAVTRRIDYAGDFPTVSNPMMLGLHAGFGFSFTVSEHVAARITLQDQFRIVELRTNEPTLGGTYFDQRISLNLSAVVGTATGK